MNRLFFSSSADAMDVDRPLLHDVKPFAAIAFVKKIIAFVELFRNNEGSDSRNIGGWQSHEELTTPKRIFGNKLFELAGLNRHSRKLSPRLSIVARKFILPRSTETLATAPRPKLPPRSAR